MSGVGITYLWTSKEFPPFVRLEGRRGDYEVYTPEQTCKWELEHSGTLYDKWRCSKCGYLFVEPRCDHGYTDLEPNYCPNCGSRVLRNTPKYSETDAKVVGE